MSNIKLKWISVQSSIDIVQLYKKLEIYAYSNNIGKGFTNISIDKNKNLLAKFSSKMVKKEVIYDPLGYELEVENVAFESISFSFYKINKKHGVITCYNPPRSVKSLIIFMNEILNKDLYIDDVNVDIKNFIHEMKNTFNCNLISVQKTKVSNLLFNENSRASVEVTSKNNALEDIEKYAEGRKFIVNRLCGYFLADHFAGGKFEISNTGVAVIDKENINLFNSIFYKLKEDTL